MLTPTSVSKLTQTSPPKALFGAQLTIPDGANPNHFYFSWVKFSPDKPRKSFLSKMAVLWFYTRNSINLGDRIAHKFRKENWKKAIPQIKEAFSSVEGPVNKAWYLISPLAQWGLDSLTVGISFAFRTLSSDTHFMSISPSLNDFNDIFQTVEARRKNAGDYDKKCQEVEDAYNKIMKPKATEATT